MTGEQNRTGIIFEAAALMLLLQLLRKAIEQCIEPFLPQTGFAARMSTAAAMLILTSVIFFYARLRKTPLSVFPERFSKRYAIASFVAVALLLSAPVNFSGGCQPILLQIYGCVITPVFEELVFRGYLWNRFNSVMRDERNTFIWNIALFAVWHLGYMIPQILEGNFFAVLTKLIAGLIYGVILGFVRRKTHNCYATMLVHGVLNLFMI